MAATDGDTADLVETALSAIWNADDQRVEVHATDVSTGTGGSGSSTITWNEAFLDGTVFAVGSPDSDARVHYSSLGSSQGTVNVAGGPASSTVTVYTIVVGPQEA